MEDLKDITPQVDEMFRRLTKTAVVSSLYNIDNQIHHRRKKQNTINNVTNGQSKIEI